MTLEENDFSKSKNAVSQMKDSASPRNS